jgi:hypothetical protein
MVIRVRRQVGRSGFTFDQLLEKIIDCPEALSRERVNRLYTGAVDHEFDRFVGNGSLHIEPHDVKKDQGFLRQKIAPLKTYGDKVIAHSTRQYPPATFNQLDEAIDCLRQLREKYHALLCGSVPVILPPCDP